MSIIKKISIIIILIISIATLQIDIYATEQESKLQNNTEVQSNNIVENNSVTVDDENNCTIETKSENLKTLKVENFNLYPKFNSKIYKYNLTINEDIEQIEVLAEPEDPNNKVRITGNTNLKKGNNRITITVATKDGIIKTEYIINTYISESNVEIQEEDKTPAIIAIFVGVVVIIVLGIYIISKKA